MNPAVEAETRPRQYGHVSTVCVEGHGTACASDHDLVVAMVLAVIPQEEEL